LAGPYLDGRCPANPKDGHAYQKSRMAAGRDQPRFDRTVAPPQLRNMIAHGSDTPMVQIPPIRIAGTRPKGAALAADSNRAVRSTRDEVRSHGGNAAASLVTTSRARGRSMTSLAKLSPPVSPPC